MMWSWKIAIQKWNSLFITDFFYIINTKDIEKAEKTAVLSMASSENEIAN